MAEGDLRNWLGHKLRRLLGFDDVRAIIDYVMNVSSGKELEDHLKVKSADMHNVALTSSGHSGRHEAG
jgi:hypothetical protein